MVTPNNVTNTLAHTTWNCKYHIVFAPKYRRMVFYKEKRSEVKEIIKTLCTWKGVDIIEGEICPDHVHLLLSIPPKMSVSGFMGYLKGKSSLMIFQRYGNMKYAYRNVSNCRFKSSLYKSNSIFISMNSAFVHFIATFPLASPNPYPAHSFLSLFG